MTDRQKEIWRKITASEPVDFFSTAATRGMLADYCAHRETMASLCEIINTFKPEWLKLGDGAKRYHELLKMRDLETRAATSLATKLRLTNQSRYVPHAAATASQNVLQGKKPWED